MFDSTAFATRQFRRAAIKWSLAALAALGVPFANSVNAQSYPNRPITVIWPSSPGSSTENVLRALAAEAGKRLGQQVLIENRPGAGSTLGLTAMKNTKPDGYFLNIAPHAALVHTPLLNPNFTIEIGKDYVPMMFLLEFPLALAANIKVPFSDVQGMIAYAKANPKKLNFVIQEASVNHLFVLRFQELTGTQFTLVGYKSSAGAVPDLVSGQVDISTASATVKPMVDAGKLKVVGVSSKERWSVFPNSQTLVEAGVPIVDSSWYVLVAGAGMQQEVINKVTGAFSDSIKQPAMQKMYADAGLISHPDMTAREIAQRLAQEKAIWEPIIKKAGLKAQ